MSTESSRQPLLQASCCASALLCLFLLGCGEWHKAGFSSDDAKLLEGARLTPAQAILWRDMGLTPSESIAWAEKGFSPEQAVRWMRARFSASLARDWSSRGFDPVEASSWRSAIPDPESAGEWRARNLQPQDKVTWEPVASDPREISNWKALGVAPEVARKWKDAGFSANEVKERKAEQISDYYLPPPGKNRSLFRNLVFGGERIVYHIETGGSYKVVEANRFMNETQSIIVESVTIHPDEIILDYDVRTNPLVTNKTTTYNPKQVLLRLPTGLDEASWKYSLSEGDVKSCVARFIVAQFAGETGRAIEVTEKLYVKGKEWPVTKLLYLRGHGLIRDEIGGVPYGWGSSGTTHYRVISIA